jgi:predicted NodU family carbamoyl transferase
LNCVNNFKYVQKFKDINFFIDPVPHDAGTAIGVALYCNDYK